jgi:L-threonylcarbamoyladenylate synthase
MKRDWTVPPDEPAPRPTLRLTVDPEALDAPAAAAALERAAEILRSGGTVAFPTETVYGLGAKALDEDAVRKIFAAKRRPAWDPLIVHVSDAGQLSLVAREIPERARRLMEAFWPGPLTLLLEKTAGIPPVVTAERPKVGVRLPAHPVAQRLIALAGTPVAAPSANSFGRTSPTSAKFVLEDLDGRIDAVIDCGESPGGLESTVIDPGAEPPVLYRPGMIPLARLEEICGPIQVHRPGRRDGSESGALPSPGVGLKHYAPRAKLILFDLDAAGIARAVQQAEAVRAEGALPGFLLPEAAEAAGLERLGATYRWGRWSDAEELARRLFAGLRELDSAGAAVIFCPLPKGDGVAEAIRDRLLKAAL